MTTEYIDTICRESIRTLRPSGYLARWIDPFGLCSSQHLRVVDETCQVVDLIAWDNLHMGMGHRSRRRGDYLVVYQKPPIKAKSTWLDHGIPDRWSEKVDRKIHPHVKPFGLIKRVIAAVTQVDDLVIDPAAGSFVVMHAAHRLGREFIGVDIAFNGEIRELDHPRQCA
jgi:site-specific DNA-methyltransferase (adenine-specific)